jgi:CRP-like cAMP-binding protein
MSVLRTALTTAQRLYRRFFQPGESTQFDAAADALRHSQLFQHVPRGVLRELTEAVHRRGYSRDEYIYYERDPGLGLYVVQRGRVRLLTEDDEGAAHEMRTVDEHEAFGVLSLFGDFRRLETAQAVTETRLLGFFRPDLRTLIQRHPRAGAAVLLALSRHLSARQSQMIDLMTSDQDKLRAMRLRDKTLQQLRE